MRSSGSLRVIASLFLGLLLTGSAWAHRSAGPPVPQDSREFFVDESKLPFDELPGLPSTREWGIDHGAGFRIEVPDDWNGDLIMYTHGFRGEGAELTVDNPPLRAYYLSRGFAWAASSYSANFYDVRAGVESTNSLVRYFRRHIARPDRVFITGFSMGGHVIGAAIEQFPNFRCPDGRRGRLCRRFARILGRFSGGVKYDGAAPACGVMGDTALFDYFGDFSYGAEALAGVPSQFPPPDDYIDSILLPTLFALYENPLEVLGANPSSAVLNAQGEKLRALTTIRSGGPRPLADFSFRFFQQLLFSFSGSDGTVSGIVSGNIYDNIGRVFQLDTDPALSPDEQALNDMILRIARDPGVNRSRFLKLERIPIIRGRLSIPVISIHTLGDLFVPFSMEQIYAREAIARGREAFLVSRATRAVGHCEFSPEELIETFDDLISWVDTGVRPAGDDILDPETVADPLFGCQFSRGTTATRPFAPCP
ncbi:MAG TPA: alpha/beta hydrolase [Deltaproteobacteria bacterium]|nr:alpha/beta hydrolase [Deltaproteobacteria bacterium]